MEFLGNSSFVPGLWLAGILFFLTNCWILGIIVDDIKVKSRVSSTKKVQ